MVFPKILQRALCTDTIETAAAARTRGRASLCGGHRGRATQSTSTAPPRVRLAEPAGASRGHSVREGSPPCPRHPSPCPAPRAMQLQPTGPGRRPPALPGRPAPPHRPAPLIAQAHPQGRRPRVYREAESASVTLPWEGRGPATGPSPSPPGPRPRCPARHPALRRRPAPAFPQTSRRGRLRADVGHAAVHGRVPGAAFSEGPRESALPRDAGRWRGLAGRKWRRRPAARLPLPWGAPPPSLACATCLG